MQVPGHRTLLTKPIATASAPIFWSYPRSLQAACGPDTASLLTKPVATASAPTFWSFPRSVQAACGVDTTILLTRPIATASVPIFLNHPRSLQASCGVDWVSIPALEQVLAGAAACALCSTFVRPTWHRRRLQSVIRSGQRRDGLHGGLPGLDMVQNLWRRRLRVTAVLSVILIAMWISQGLGGWQSLHVYNARQPGWRMLPSSAAIEGWLLGVHKYVTVHGHRIQITMSALQRDLMMDVPFVIERGQQHRLLTACFLHNSVFQILFNLGYLYTLAPLEVGSPGAYLCTFFLAGIAGNAAFLESGVGSRALGASGGICGLVGFELVARLRQRQMREFRKVMQAVFGLLVIGVLVPGVNNIAHFGGLATGLVVALLTARRSGYRSPLLPWPLLLVGLLVWPRARHFLVVTLQALKIACASPGALGNGLRMTV